MHQSGWADDGWGPWGEDNKNMRWHRKGGRKKEENKPLWCCSTAFGALARDQFLSRYSIHSIINMTLGAYLPPVGLAAPAPGLGSTKGSGEVGGEKSAASVAAELAEMVPRLMVRRWDLP